MSADNQYENWRDEVAAHCEHVWEPFVEVKSRYYEQHPIPQVRIMLICQRCCGFTYQTYSFIGAGRQGWDDLLKTGDKDGPST